MSKHEFTTRVKELWQETAPELSFQDFILDFEASLAKQGFDEMQAVPDTMYLNFLTRYYTAA